MSKEPLGSPESQHVDRLTNQFFRGRVTRAQLFARATALGLSASSLAALAAACGGGSSASTGAVASGGAPGAIRRGGRLVVGERDGSAADSLSPFKVTTSIDGMRTRLLYDNLVEYNSAFEPQPRLAKEWESSSDQKQWTFRLVDNATFHDGTAVTADDVISTVNILLDEKAGATAGPALAFMKGAIMKKMDPHTVRFTLPKPYVDFPNVWGIDGTQIVPKNFDPKTADSAPNGSGPFKYASFTAGQESLFVKNESYWREGYPYLDEIQLIDITDENARNNAFLGGQIDVSPNVDVASIAVLEGANAKLLRIPGGSFVDIALVQDDVQFQDPRVREAFALAVDRQKVIDVVYLGNAHLGNDHPISESYPHAPTDIPQRERDVERAKQLLAEAGHPDGIDATLYTSDAGFGMVNTAVVVAGSLKEAGINVKVQKWPPDTYWSEVWLKKNMYVSFWSQRPIADVILSLGWSSGAPWNEGHINDPELDRLVAQAREIPDPDERKRLYTEALQRVHDSAATIIPAFSDLVHVARKTVTIEKMPPPVSTPDFHSAWLSA
jgi:peptide/nickel transport system substrate-binding protein